MPARVPAVLAIAGSDSGGGAGIQADLKAFAACGVHGMTALTALTAQNTVGVSGIQPVPPDFIVAQVHAVAEDIGVDAVKVGMLGTAEAIQGVREALDLLGAGPNGDGPPVVIDPVMVAESGAVLLDDEAREALVSALLPLATVVTPNLPEARVLAAATGATQREAAGEAGATPAAEDVVHPGGEVAELARAVRALGPAAVVVTGGHRDEATDVFLDGERLETIPGRRHPDGAAHGSGCTHSSALAAHLALGFEPLEAARAAKAVASEAVRTGLRGIGAGAGPVDVFDLTGRQRPRSSWRGEPGPSRGSRDIIAT